MKELVIGIKNELTSIVKESDTAISVGSGDLPVYATPAMIALMEKACATSLHGYLPDDSTTVGVSINIKHLAATPLNMKVKVTCELIRIDKRKLVFNIIAFDEKEKIGEGLHERFIIKKESFLEKTIQKKQQ